MQILTAEYVLPVSSDPIARGAVAIDGDTIAAVGEIEAIAARFPDAETLDLGAAAIMPGMVNCHAHLEITAMRGALDEVEHDFRSWLLRLNSIRAGWTDEDVEASASAGARACASCAA